MIYRISILLLCLLIQFQSAAMATSKASQSQILINGSTTLEPVSRAFARHFNTHHAGFDIQITATGSGDGAKALINGKCDIANMSRFMKPKEFKQAIHNNVLPVFHTVAMDGLMIIVHPDNPVYGLSLEQIRRIYSRKITNWRQVGGPDLDITVISRDSHSGTQKVFLNLVMDGNADSPHFQMEHNHLIQEKVQLEPGAIGYVGMAFLDGVKPLVVDSIQPTRANVASGKYPIARPLFMVTNGYPKLGSPVQQFVNHFTQPEGMQAIESVGYVPLKTLGEITFIDIFELYWHWLILFLLVIMTLFAIRSRFASHAIQLREMQVQQLRNYLSDIIDSMPSVLIGVDENICVTEWNAHAENMIGVSKVDATGSPLQRVLPYSGKVISKIADHIDEQHVVTDRDQEWEIDGEIRYLDITVYPLQTSERIGAVIRIDDVTSRVEMEKKIQQSSKMEAIGQLAGGIAHDFNNMLGGILTAAQLISARINEPERCHKYVKIIEDSAQQASDLIRKLLDYSRRSSILSGPVDIHLAMEKSIQILKRSLDRKIYIQVELSEQKPVITGDFSQLQNVILNLGINAGDAMPSGGTLTFRSSLCKLDSDYCEKSYFNLAPGEFVHIEVCDTGIGIPEKVLEKIFDPFFTTKDPGKGTGLGLASVLGIIEQHRGEVSVYSEPGHGTVFHLYLPIASDNPELESTSAGQWIRGSGTILVIDDEDMVREMAQVMLQVLGYTVLTATNGEEGLKRYQEEQSVIDIVLLDMIMPVMNGRECFHQLKQINPDVKVVVLTGFTQRSYLEELMNEGIEGYLAKPYRVEELSRVIADTLNPDIS